MFFKPKSSNNGRNRLHASGPRQRRNTPSERQKPVIFSYYARKSNDDYTVSDEDDAVPARDRQNLAQSRAAAQSRPKRLTGRRLAIYAGIVLLGAFVVYELLLLKPPTVIVTGDSSATIAGTHSAAYQQTATELFNQSVSSRTKLTINTQHIDTQLQAKFPELALVHTTVPLIGNAVTVHVMPAQAVLADVLSNGTTVAIDARGIDITDAATTHIDASLPRVIDQSGAKASPGQVILPSTTVSFVTTLLYQLKSQSIPVSSVILPVGGSELDIAIQGQGFIGRFNLQEDARLQAGTFAATLNNLNTQHITPAKYIDVRVPGRAYYL